MSPSSPSLEQQREQVLTEMRAIDRMRRGTLSQHFLRRQRDGQTVTHGPYFVLQGCLRGRKFSQHIPADQLPQVTADVQSYQQFQALVERFVTLTDQLTQAVGSRLGLCSSLQPRMVRKNRRLTGKVTFLPHIP